MPRKLRSSKKAIKTETKVIRADESKLSSQFNLYLFFYHSQKFDDNIYNFIRANPELANKLQNNLLKDDNLDVNLNEVMKLSFEIITNICFLEYIKIRTGNPEETIQNLISNLNDINNSGYDIPPIAIENMDNQENIF